MNYYEKSIAWYTFPSNKYMFKVNKKDTNMKRQRGGGVFIINFQQMSLFF